MNLGDNIPTWNVVCGIAIAGMIGCLVFDKVVHKPTVAAGQAKIAKDTRDMMVAANKADADLKDVQQSIDTFAWSGNVSDVGPAVLDRVNRVAASKGVKVSTFRPQRVQDLAPLKAAEYTVSVQGPYLPVVAFVKELEASGSKLVVTSAQVSSTDAASSQVSA